MEMHSPKKLLYKESSIQIATFLGGPIAAGYLLATNFKKLGRTSLFKKTWYITFVILVSLILVALIIPGIFELPPLILPIAFTVSTSFVLINYQTDSIKSHIKLGGDVYPIWRSVIIGIIGLLLSLAIQLILNKDSLFS